MNFYAKKNKQNKTLCSEPFLNTKFVTEEIWEPNIQIMKFKLLTSLANQDMLINSKSMD